MTDDQAERPMPPEERAWLDVATHALYRAQDAAGVQALAADELVLLHRYQAAHRVLAELTRTDAKGPSGKIGNER